MLRLKLIRAKGAKSGLKLQANLFATNHKTFNAIIIGGGPAGVNCALELNYCGVDCLIVDKEEQIGGQLWQIGEEIENFAGGNFKNGAAMAQSMHKQIAKTGSQVSLLLGRTVESIDAQRLTVTVAGDVYQSKTILLASGYRLKKMNLPGVNLFQQDIIYRDEQPVSVYAGSRVAVLGGGDNALLKSLDLAEAAEQVFLLNRSRVFRARGEFLTRAKLHPRIEIIENTELESLSGTSKLNGARLIDKSTSRIRNLSVDKIFVKIGYTPNTESFRGQIDMDETGHIITDNLGACSVAGVFAAGDIIAGSCPRIATACGGGAIAAQSIMLSLGRRLS